MTQFVERGHLGGYIAGGDDATFYPALWEWLVEEHGVRSVVDVGCGEGIAVRYFRELGATSWGIEGVAQNDPGIFQHDYTAGPWGAEAFGESGVLPGFDLIWSCEFVEHVEERFMPNFLRTFEIGKMLLITHAEPGQAGYHHVNCQPAAYWIGAMAAIGYRINWDLTMLCRAKAMKNESPWNHFARSGLAFVASGSREKMLDERSRS